MKLKQSILSAAMLMAAALPMQAQAATATGIMQVTANVTVPSASVNVAGPLNFGTVLQGQVGMTTTSFDVTVSNAVPYSIAFGAGLYGNTVFVVKDTTQTLPAYPGQTASAGYYLYSDNTKATAYSPDPANAPVITGLTGNGAAQTYPLYAEVKPLSPAQGGIWGPGTYTDTITITVTY